jgi:chitinase
LAEIKAAIGNKGLSIAAPGLERDMLAYTKNTVPKINAIVDMVNVSHDIHTEAVLLNG